MIMNTVKTAMNCLPNRGNRRGSKMKEKHQKEKRFQNEKLLRRMQRLKLFNGTCTYRTRARAARNCTNKYFNLERAQNMTWISIMNKPLQAPIAHHG
jgi:hypothetical protein